MRGGRRSGAGRPRLLTNRQLVAFRNLLANNIGLSSSELQNLVKSRFHVTMDARTFRLYAARVGAPYVVVPRHPPLSDQARRKRVQFAREHLHDSGWRNVVCADEASFMAHTSIIHARVPRGAGISRPRLTHQLSINVWWAASADFYAEPFFYTQSLNGTLYRTILQENLRPLLQRMPYTARLLQDNLPAHYTSPCRRFYEQEQVNLLRDFPPYSPDLNPIENWWSIAQREVNKRSPATLAELREAVRFGLRKVSASTRRVQLWPGCQDDCNL